MVFVRMKPEAARIILPYEPIGDVNNFYLGHKALTVKDHFNIGALFTVKEVSFLGSYSSQSTIIEQPWLSYLHCLGLRK